MMSPQRIEVMLYKSFAIALLTLPLFGQRLEPVKWSLTADQPGVPPGSQFLLRLTARVDPGWRLYSLTTPRGGANPTTIQMVEDPSIESWRVYQPTPFVKFDPNFNLDTETYEKETVFLILGKLRADAAGELKPKARIRYQACTEKECLNPKRLEAEGTLKVAPGPDTASTAVPPGYTEFTGQRSATRSAAASTPKDVPQDRSAFLLVAFGFGLASIFTPCVFPMIPITMSYFLERPQGTRRGAIGQALLFCAGIVVLFTSMGAGLTAALGPFGIVQLGSNPWVNLFIFCVFLIFGLSLLGAFELALPSGLLTRMDQASRRGGSLGTLLMGLTFSLASFACVGPFVGSLLAASVQGGLLQPVIGMATFATGLSTPFFLLALFPRFLKRLPRSGGWLARVKIVMGFILLAVSLKYLANVDQVFQANLLTRERILSAWIVLFALPALYLLGYLRLPGVDAAQELGPGRLIAVILLFSFSISLIPGMFGGRLGEVEALLPPPQGQGSFASADGRLRWLKNQYPEALERAKAENKLVFVNFTGYACGNCHWMKANMFARPEIATALEKFILVELYTDGTDEESEQNQQLQEQKFSTVSIPFYAIVDPSEKIVATFPRLTRNPSEFLSFLNQT